MAKFAKIIQENNENFLIRKFIKLFMEKMTFMHGILIKILVISLTFASFIYAQEVPYVHPHTGWSFFQTNQDKLFNIIPYFQGEELPVIIDGVSPVVAIYDVDGDGIPDDNILQDIEVLLLNPGPVNIDTVDAFGLFYNNGISEICIGWTYYAIETNEGYATLKVFGNDFYCNSTDFMNFLYLKELDRDSESRENRRETMENKRKPHRQRAENQRKELATIEVEVGGLRWGE